MLARNKEGPPKRPLLFTAENLLRLCSRHETVATGNRGHLQVQRRVLGVAAFIEDAELGLVAGDNAHESVCFVVLSEVGTKTALSVLNWLHGCRSLVNCLPPIGLTTTCPRCLRFASLHPTATLRQRKGERLPRLIQALRQPSRCEERGG